MYVAALDDSARPSRPLSNTAALCHALRLDGRTCVCFEILRGGGAPESFQRGASGRRRGQLVRYLAGVVRRRADER